MRRALDNARSARDHIAAAVRERAELTGLLRLSDDGVEDLPGSLTVLDTVECLRLLATRTVGRLCYVARAGVPDVTPVNYTVHDGHVLIRSGAGPKLQAAERCERVAFEVDNLDERDRAGWSVVVHGRAERITERIDCDASGLPDPWAAGPRVHTIRVTPGRVTGRRLAGVLGSSGPEREDLRL